MYQNYQHSNRWTWKKLKEITKKFCEELYAEKKETSCYSIPKREIRDPKKFQKSLFKSLKMLFYEFLNGGKYTSNIKQCNHHANTQK